MPRSTARLTASQRQHRDESVRLARGAGDSVERIALRYGISNGRVYEILRGDNRSTRRAAGRRGAAQGLNRRFGVEIEFFGIARSRVETWLRSDDRMNRWRVVNDCSVTGSGLELVSPPLRGEDGMDALRYATRKLREMGARVDSSCGLHVHHDMAGVDTAAVKRFVTSYVQNQELINWLIAPSRRNGRWCSAWRDGELESFNRSSGVSGPYSRYRAINPASYHRHGTIEIRQHQGTLNFSKIERWIMLGQAMVDAAVSAGSAVPQQGTLRNLLTAVSLDDDTSAYLMGRALQFGCETV